jgi:hypothetical protein
MAVALAAFLSVEVGCSSKVEGPTLIPVVGKVTLDGKPASEGAVAFRDVGSGQVQPAGLISADGAYKVYLGQQEGAPAGEYRVLVFVRQTPRTPTGEIAGLPKMIMNQKFANEHSTPLRIEVKENVAPGAYDLAVTR